MQNPYTVAPLPRPINRSTGRYVVGDVYGGTPGSKKRKRGELAIGIDGEGVNLYDVGICHISSLSLSNLNLDISSEIGRCICSAASNNLHLRPMFYENSNVKKKG